jgi:hypothetical protein
MIPYIVGMKVILTMGIGTTTATLLKSEITAFRLPMLILTCLDSISV